ncbi:MAG: hypothetical protein AAGE52_28435 [Myxococcota bacterium]
MTHPPDRDLDDAGDLDALELPPLPPLGSDEEVGVGEVGIELDVGDEESIDLDDTEGLDDFDPVDFLDLKEEEGLLDDETSDLEFDPDLQVDASEYGWTQDTEADPELWEGDDPLVDELDAWTDDDGEVGTEGDSLLAFEGDDEVVGLPPLRTGDDDEEETADDLELEDDGAIVLPDLSFEDEIRLMGSELPPPADVTASVVSRGAVYDLAFDDAAVWVAGDDLQCIGPNGVIHSPAAKGLEPEDLLSIAVLPGSEGRTLVVGTRLGGVFRSLDRGETFAPINGWRSGGEPSVGCRVAFDRAGRLWMWAGGALHRSRDLGNRWAGPVLPSPVVDAVLDDGRLVALCAAGAHLEVLRCRDDGLAFEAIAPTLPRGDGAPRLAVHGDRVAVAFEGDVQGPWLFEETWRREGSLGGVHLPLLTTAGLFGALHIAGRDRGVVLRANPAAVMVDLVTLFGELPVRLREAGADQRIHALLASDRQIWIASGMGLVSWSR